MSEAEILQQLQTLGITSAELFKVAGACFASVVASFLLGWTIGIASQLIKNV